MDGSLDAGFGVGGKVTTDFFGRNGFEPIGEQVVEPEVFSQLTLSQDEGVAEFLDLARVKQNTLGNTRMLKRLQ